MIRLSYPPFPRVSLSGAQKREMTGGNKTTVGETSGECEERKDQSEKGYTLVKKLKFTLNFIHSFQSIC